MKLFLHLIRLVIIVFSIFSGFFVIWADMVVFLVIFFGNVFFIFFAVSNINSLVRVLEITVYLRLLVFLPETIRIVLRIVIRSQWLKKIEIVETNRTRFGLPVERVSLIPRRRVVFAVVKIDFDRLVGIRKAGIVAEIGKFIFYKNNESCFG